MSSPAEEKRYRRRLITNAVLLFFLASALSLTLLFLPSEDYFQFYLNQSDKYLSQKDYPDMEGALKKAARHAKSRDQWFSIFKRSYMASVEQDNFEFFNGIINNSRKFLKGGTDLEALNTASLLWVHQYEKAAASLYTIQSDKYKTLIAESLLSYDVYRNYDLQEMTPLEFIKDKIQYQEDPVFFESVGIKSDNPDLLYNAALLSMESGDFDRAASLLQRLPGNMIDPYRLAVLHYDLKQYGEAFEALNAQAILDDIKGNQRFTIHQQIADLLYMSGKKAEALKEYQKALELNPAGSWKNYRNIARVSLDSGYSRRARVVLMEGMSLFQNNIDLLKDSVVFYHKDYPVEVKKDLDEYVKRFSELTEPQLMKIRYFPEQKSSVQYQAQIWNLFNMDDSSDEVTRFLLWYLSGVGDLDSMDIVLERYNKGDENPFWYYFYQSVIALHRGYLDEAILSMDKASSLNSQWYMNYNMAVLEGCKGNSQKTEELLVLAADDLSRQSSVFNQNVYLSRIYFDRAVLLVDKKEFNEALILLQKALDLDSMNVRAGTLLNKIQ